MSEHFALAETSSVREELFLEVLGDPSLDDDIVAVALGKE